MKKYPWYYANRARKAKLKVPKSCYEAPPIPRVEVPEVPLLEQQHLLRRIPYCEYTHSRWWKFRKQQYLADRILHRGEGALLECDCCCQHVTSYERLNDGRRQIDGWPRFHLHHVSYENLGNERDEDLRWVCSPCHNLIHLPESKAAIYYVAMFGDSELLARAGALRPNHIVKTDDGGDVPDDEHQMDCNPF